MSIVRVRTEPNGDRLTTSLQGAEVVVVRTRGNGKPPYTVASVPAHRARALGII